MKQKIRIANLGKKASEETKQKMRGKRRTNNMSKETKALFSKRMKENNPMHNPITAKKVGMTQRGKKTSITVKNKQSIAAKKLWQDEIYCKNWKEAADIKPNKLEVKMQNLLDDLFPKEWKYVGDGSIRIDGKCPDFINVNGQKKIIEVFGDYWHKGQNPQDRIDVFKPYGYKTLVLWESEINNKPREVMTKLIEFNELAQHSPDVFIE